MPMSNLGLTKLMEECGELVQIAAKKTAYIDQTLHPDGVSKTVDSRLEDEMGDVMAAIWFVTDKLKLSEHDIFARALTKIATYKRWDT